MDADDAQPGSQIVRGSAPAGWYPNPDGSGGRRYFDGQRWTDRVRRPGPDPHAPAPAPASPTAIPLGRDHPSHEWRLAGAASVGVVIGLVIGLVIGGAGSNGAHPSGRPAHAGATSRSPVVKSAPARAPTQPAHTTATGVTLALTP